MDRLEKHYKKRTLRGHNCKNGILKRGNRSTSSGRNNSIPRRRNSFIPAEGIAPQSSHEQL
jgi:hypothetical protein